MKVTRKSLVGVLLALAAVPAAEAQRGRTLDAGGGLYAQQSFDRALIREPSGEARELSLPLGATLYRLERLGDGWIATGDVDGEGRTDLLLLVSEGGVERPFPAPPNIEDLPLRGNPVPLIQDGQLLGLAWIAGSRVIESQVYAALWSGTDWAQPELVSPTGPGTQIGLAGAVLADGSWILLWSAYDGTDDEIVWSRRSGGKWTAPAALHPPNDRPDIVPSVVATGRGALAAWSSSDGTTYRVKVAVLEDGAWSEPLPVGRPGSIHPTLTRGADTTRMLYRTALPYTWTLVELTDEGGILRRAVVPQETTFRPGLAQPGGPRPAFEWPGLEVAVPLQLEAEWQPQP